jgi:hypothetical protein
MQPPSLLQRINANFSTEAKSLISLEVDDCLESGQLVAERGLARTWRSSEQVPHKVIHRRRGEARKAFRIIDLAGVRRNRLNFDG